MNDAAQIDPWLDLWLENTSHNIELRFLPSKKQVFSRDHDELRTAILQANGQNIYFGVYGRDGTRGGKGSVKECNCLFVDIDFKDLPNGQTEADNILSGFPHRPTMVINSGGGYHAYWMLSEPVKASAEIENYLYGLALELKGDTQSAEIARVLRVPGTKNKKYEPHRQVSTISFDESLKYDLDMFTVYKRKKNIAAPSSGGVVHEMFGESRKDNDLFHTANCLTKGGMPQGEQEQILTRLVNTWGEHDPEWVAAKVRSAMNRQADKERNLSQEIRNWIDDTKSGWVSVTQCDRELQIVTKEDKASRRQIFHRLCDKGVLERDKNKTESYQVLHRDERIMDPDNISLDTVDVILPLGLSNKTTLFHKAIVTVAGVTGMGKTMFALNFIRENMGTHEIFYLNSEMSDQELKYKKLCFTNFPYSGWKFQAVEVHGAMSESIRTDKINVIDYLQAPTDKLYMIRDLIDNIKKKLGIGMALILIQRKDKNPWGEGGIFSAQASSIYINLSFGSLEVMKNRFREADQFRGCEKRNFEIKNGVISHTSGWYSEGAKEEKQIKTLVDKYADLNVKEREPGEDD
jgi:hypothetical protein